MWSLMSCQFIWSRKSPTTILPITSKRFLPSVSSEKKNISINFKIQYRIVLFCYFCRIFAKMSARLYKMILKQNMPYLKIRMKTLPNRYYDLQNHFLRKKVVAHKRFDQKNSINIPHKIFLGTYRHICIAKRMQPMH